MDNLGLQGYINFLAFEVEDGFGLKSAGKVKREEGGSFFRKTTYEILVIVLYFVMVGIYEYLAGENLLGQMSFGLPVLESKVL